MNEGVQAVDGVRRRANQPRCRDALATTSSSRRLAARGWVGGQGCRLPRGGLKSAFAAGDGARCKKNSTLSRPCSSARRAQSTTAVRSRRCCWGRRAKATGRCTKSRASELWIRTLIGLGGGRARPCRAARERRAGPRSKQRVRREGLWRVLHRRPGTPPRGSSDAIRGVRPAAFAMPARRRARRQCRRPVPAQVASSAWPICCSEPHAERTIGR